jgi:hypothetical protein
MPENPTTADSIKVISFTTFSSGGCHMTDSSIDIAGSTITIVATHYAGIATVICHSVDTINLGKVNSGTYELIYQIKTGTFPGVSDTDTIAFSVKNPNGIFPSHNSCQEIIIFPNPSTSEVNIDLNAKAGEMSRIDIYSVFGQKVKTITVKEENTTIDIGNSADGIYFIVITSGDGRSRTQKIIKNTP